jgi:hypothetical protein
MNLPYYEQESEDPEETKRIEAEKRRQKEREKAAEEQDKEELPMGKRCKYLFHAR